MLVTVFLALFLPCALMSVIFVVYTCLLWYSAGNEDGGSELDYSGPGEKTPAPRGLTPEELQKLPRVTGNELVMGNDCAVCLDVIEGEQLARLVPRCNHGFHLECADAWLSKNSACPLCRATVTVGRQPDGAVFDSEASPC